MKQYIAGLLCLLCIFSLATARAFPAQTHDQHLETVFFGDRGLQSGDSKALDAFEALKHASYLCIDQYNHSGQVEHLDSLLEIRKNNWVMFLSTQGHYPKTVSEIDYVSNYAHRRYTHLGWDVEYKSYDKEKTPDWLTKRWPKRKEILLSTVEAVFDFNPWPWAIESTRGELMCRLIYSIHVLGDHIYFQDYTTFCKTAEYLLPLGGFRNEKTIISELTYVCNQLFGASASELVIKLHAIESEIRGIRNFNGSVSESNFPQYQHDAHDVLSALEDYLPQLLMEQDFFKNVFYSHD